MNDLSRHVTLEIEIMGLEDLEQLRLEAKLTRESLGANYSRYLELLRHAELAEKVMEIDDPRQKYSALSHLIDKIVKDYGDAYKAEEYWDINKTREYLTTIGLY